MFCVEMNRISVSSKNANINSSEHYNIHAVYFIYAARSFKYI